MHSEGVDWLAQSDPGLTRVELPDVVTKDNFVSGDGSGHRLCVRYFRRESDAALIAKAWFNLLNGHPRRWRHSVRLCPPKEILDRCAMLRSAALPSGSVELVGLMGHGDDRTQRGTMTELPLTSRTSRSSAPSADPLSEDG
ncbi:MAG: hypothetical protein DRI90_10470 [Deltaproteobacteria bacterium]|nr:MAG: hypothetical protein DRI90_10470 [Deltaproteobacteria bacterium]